MYYYSDPALMNANSFWLQNFKLKDSDLKIQTSLKFKETQLAVFLDPDKMLGKLPLIPVGRDGMGCQSAGKGTVGGGSGVGRSGNDSFSDLEGGNEVHLKKTRWTQS